MRYISSDTCSTWLSIKLYDEIHFIRYLFYMIKYIMKVLYTDITASLTYWLRCLPREWKIPGSNPACARIFPGLSQTSDLKIGTSVATLPGAWRYRVSAGSGWPSVSILWLGEMESLICNFYLSVAACKIVWADPSQIHSYVAGTLSNQQTSKPRQ